MASVTSIPSWLERSPSEIVFEHVFLTTQPLEEPDRPAHFHSMLEMFPADRMLLFASDYPHAAGSLQGER
jgi:uncharacterized protein